MLDITKFEMETVNSLEFKPLRKLMFTLLVLAKHFNTKNENNNSWTNLQTRQIFKIADIKTSIKKQDLMLHELYNSGFIEFPKNATNLNIRVKIIMEGETICTVDNLDTIGLCYLQFCGENIKKCHSCGKLFRVSANYQKYCKECSVYKPIGTKIIICEDCGKAFEVDARNMTKFRCDACQQIYRNKKKAEWAKNNRHK